MTEHKVRIKLISIKETEEFQALMGEPKDILAARLWKVKLELLPLLKEPFPSIPKDASATDLRNALEACLVDIKTKRLILEGMLTIKPRK